MKNNYKIALKNAQMGIVPKPPKAQSQTEIEMTTPMTTTGQSIKPGPPESYLAGSVNDFTTPHEGVHGAAMINPNQSVVPDNSQLRQRSFLGKLGTKIGNIFRPDHRDLNTAGTYIDKESRKNIPTYEFNLGSGAYVDPTSIAGSSLYMKKGGGVGSSNYMKALKTAKKGGSTR